MNKFDKDKIGLYKSKGYGFAKEFCKALEEVYGKKFTPHEIHRTFHEANVPSANGMYLKERALIMIYNRQLDKIICGFEPSETESYSDYHKPPPYEMPEADMDTISKQMIQNYQTEGRHQDIKKIIISESQFTRLFMIESKNKITDIYRK